MRRADGTIPGWRERRLSRIAARLEQCEVCKKCVNLAESCRVADIVANAVFKWSLDSDTMPSWMHRCSILERLLCGAE